jgi:plasmid replication initiation protein
MNNKNELVVKSNRLIEASYRLTLAEQRIILLAITEARRTQTGLSEANLLAIRAVDYAEMFGVPENQAYEQIKEAVQTLFSRYVILRDIHPETGKDRVSKVHWVSSASYIDGAGIVQLCFAQQMVPYITRLEAEFTRYKLEKVANMSSAYAIRLYELLMQWGSVGQREIELDWLKKTLMVDKDYPRMFDFKKRVVDIAIAQINEFSDLTASYTQRKTGRNVTHLTFSFQPKEEPKPKKAKTARTPKTATAGALDAGRAKMEALVIEFLTGNESYNRRYPNIPYAHAWHVEGIRNEYLAEFDAWRGNRP